MPILAVYDDALRTHFITDATSAHQSNDWGAFAAAGCEPVFRETISGTSADRLQLATALSGGRERDVIVVARLDRLARSVRQLLPACFAAATAHIRTFSDRQQAALDRAARRAALRLRNAAGGHLRLFQLGGGQRRKGHRHDHLATTRDGR
jgi:Resolvase, N terminal domain